MAAEDEELPQPTVLSEERLKYMSRHIKDVVPDTTASDDTIKNLRCTFEGVFATSAAASLSAPHKVAAWNTLCALIDRCLASGNETDRRSFWERDYWLRAFELYLAQAHFVRSKSSRQLLSTLTAALRSTSDSVRSDLEAVKNDAAAGLVLRLAKDDDPARAKTSALALAHFVSKDVLSLDTVLQSHSDVTHSPETSFIGLEGILTTLFQWMSKGDFGSTIGQLVSVLLDKAPQLDDVCDSMDAASKLPVWAIALQRTTRTGAIDVASLRVHLLPTLFRRSSSDYFRFLDNIGVRGLFGYSRSQTSVFTEDDKELLLASLLAGKDLGLICETDGEGLNLKEETLAIPIRKIGRLLRCSSRSARLTGLSLLVTSPAATRPLFPAALVLIQRNLGHFFGDTDASFRSDVFSLIQKLVDRIRAISAVLSRQASKALPNSHADDGPQQAALLRSHQEFLNWLPRFLRGELRPTASYQHHISSLKCISILARSGLDDFVSSEHLSRSASGEAKWPFRIKVLTEDMRRTLLDLVVDPFDDVRQAAATILALYPIAESHGLELIKLALSRAEEMMLATGRADQADGVAHLYTLVHLQSQDGASVLEQLVERLTQMLNFAKTNLGRAVEKYPIHGLLTSVRYILEKDSGLPRELIKKLTACLHGIWEVVKPILCNDAPEGYLPEGMEDTTGVSTKDTLSYCWRALKEASLLLGTLLQRLASSDAETRQQLCELCFSQLAELRHRGAFSTVAQTWTTCCVRSATSATASGQPLLQAYYGRILLILRNKTTINTRRSAGLPSLLCGILVADREGLIIQQAFGDLETIARETVDSNLTQEGSLPQVHAMNFMKDLLKNSRLGEASEIYVPKALRLAADALRSDAWAVRNCGLMLFRAVIDRLLGTSDAYLEDDVYSQKRLSAEQHPQLLQTVLELLSAPSSHSDAGASKAGNVGVFPALQLLQRLSIPPTQLEQVRRSVWILTGSPVWHIRDKAARTFASLTPIGQAPDEVSALLQTTTVNQNALHGALLCAKYIVRSLGRKQTPGSSLDGTQQHLSAADTVSSCLAAILGSSDLYYDNTCPVTKGAYIDLYEECTLMLQNLEHKSSNAKNAQNTLFDLRRVKAEIRTFTTQGGSGAALRASLCRALASQLFFADPFSADEQNGVLEAMTDLSTHDADACIAFVERSKDCFGILAECVQCEPPGLLVRICDAWLGPESTGNTLQCAALELLLQISARVCGPESGEHAFEVFAEERVKAARPMLDDTSQRYMDLTLQLDAACLQVSIHATGGLDKDSMIVFQSFAQSCELAVGGESIHNREAAALAFNRLTTAWPYIAADPGVSRTLLRVALTVYDLLNDDDEDIRLLASETAARIVPTPSSSPSSASLVPVVASETLLAFMTRRWSSDGDFVLQVFLRAFGVGQEKAPSVAERLNASTATDNALFVEEKQNLYIDEASQAKTWSRVAIRIPPAYISKALLSKLSLWVEQGLDVLLSQSTSCPDGPLGWSTKPEVFTLGLQVIYGARMLLHLVKNRIRLPVPPSHLRRQLCELAYISQLTNPVWKRELDIALECSVMEQLRARYALLSELKTQVGVDPAS